MFFHLSMIFYVEVDRLLLLIFLWTFGMAFFSSFFFLGGRGGGF